VRAADSTPSRTTNDSRNFVTATGKSLELELFPPNDLRRCSELLTLTDSLTDLCNAFGAQHPLVKTVLDDKSPHDRAFELIKGTQLRDVRFGKSFMPEAKRRSMPRAIQMIDLARAIDSTARTAKKNL